MKLNTNSIVAIRDENSWHRTIDGKIADENLVSLIWYSVPDTTSIVLDATTIGSALSILDSAMVVTRTWSEPQASLSSMDLFVVRN